MEMILRHEPGFPDPLLYGHLTDTLNGQIHILLYILNDPASPRFDVDRLPDGTATRSARCGATWPPKKPPYRPAWPPARCGAACAC